jgi:hypothetical protein
MAGHGLALRLVGLEFDMARGGGLGVEDDGKVSGRKFGEELE